MMFLLLVMNFFVIPMRFSFPNFDKSINEMNMFSYYSALLFLLDGVLNLNSAYFSKGLVITDRRKIINNYIRKNFLVDLITALAYGLSQIYYPEFEAGVLIRAFKLTPLIENFDEILNLKHRG